MIIHIEGFDKNNKYFKKSIDINNITDYKYFDWFLNGKKLSSDYNDWQEDTIYTVMYNKQYIQLYIDQPNKTIITPLVSSTMTIGDLKNILSIKDTIYFNKIKLNDNKTIKSYNINNMDHLNRRLNRIFYAVSADC
jgi:hypothetical protein